MKLTTKKLFCAAGVTFLLAAGSVVYQQSQISKSQNISKLHNGVGTCFTRVSQTFTAAMIGQLSSNYLTKDFRNLSSDCFSEVNKLYREIFGQADKKVTKTLNSLISETHWFSERIEKIQSMQQAGNQDFSFTDSNLASRYSELEGLKSSFQDNLDERMSEANSNVNLANIFATMMVAFFAAVVGVLGFRDQKARNKTLQLEKVAGEMLAREEYETYKVDRLIENILNTHEYQKAWQVFQNYHAQMLEKNSQSYDDNKVPRLDHVENEVAELTEKVDFNQAFNAAFEQIKLTAFNHGIIVDFDFDQNLLVKADSEALEQVFMTVMSLAIRNSTQHNKGRKITLRSKALGGTAFFKINVANHVFNTNELEFTAEGSDSLSTDLLILKELVQDLDGSIKLKNKLSQSGDIAGSEIEITLKRVPSEAQVQTIVRGKKKDILKSFNSEV